MIFNQLFRVFIHLQFKQKLWKSLEGSFVLICKVPKKLKSYDSRYLKYMYRSITLLILKPFETEKHKPAHHLYVKTLGKLSYTLFSLTLFQSWLKIPMERILIPSLLRSLLVTFSAVVRITLPTKKYHKNTCDMHLHLNPWQANERSRSVLKKTLY